MELQPNKFEYRKRTTSKRSYSYESLTSTMLKQQSSRSQVSKAVSRTSRTSRASSKAKRKAEILKAQEERQLEEYRRLEAEEAAARELELRQFELEREAERQRHELEREAERQQHELECKAERQ